MTKQPEPFRRSQRNRILAGESGGLGAFFGISPFWFRLGFIIPFIPGGVPGIIMYLLLWLIVHSE